MALLCGCGPLLLAQHRDQVHRISDESWLCVRLGQKMIIINVCARACLVNCSFIYNWYIQLFTIESSLYVLMFNIVYLSFKWRKRAQSICIYFIIHPCLDGLRRRSLNLSFYFTSHCIRFTAVDYVFAIFLASVKKLLSVYKLKK